MHSSIHTRILRCRSTALFILVAGASVGDPQSARRAEAHASRARAPQESRCASLGQSLVIRAASRLRKVPRQGSGHIACTPTRAVSSRFTSTRKVSLHTSSQSVCDRGTLRSWFSTTRTRHFGLRQGLTTLACRQYLQSSLREANSLQSSFQEAKMVIK